MGDIKKLKKKYWTPRHPWNKIAIEEEGKLKREYGLVNKTEMYIAASFLKKYKNIAKKLIADKTEQGKKEKAQMMNKLHRLGLLPLNAELDQVLSLQLKDILERRIQSVIFRKSFARSMKQARQFITHRHILIGDKEMTSPSFLTTTADESSITFKKSSSLSDEAHLERALVVRDPKKVAADAEKQKAREDKFAKGKRGRKNQNKRPMRKEVKREK